MKREEPSGYRDLTDLFEALAASGVATAGSAIVATRDDTLFERSFNRVDGSVTEESNCDARYDLASLTKVCSATLAVDLDERGRLPLDLAVGEIWQGVAPRLESTRLEHLLRHKGGFQPWAPLYHLCRSRNDAEKLLLGGNFLGAESDTYSDLGYILWGLAAERVTGTGLTELFGNSLGRLSSEVTMGGTSADDSPIRSCLLDTDREQRLADEQGLTIDLLGAPSRGEVQDGNARFLSGVAAHAGLFGSARGLLGLARAWLDSTEVPRGATPTRALSGEGPYGLGWARRATSASAGDALSVDAFGHIGFTGCSLWIDPSTERIFVLAAHRATTDTDLATWRRAFHELGQRA